jgi:hypothetical protein
MEEDPSGERSSIVNRQPGCGSDKPQAVEHASNADRVFDAEWLPVEGKSGHFWELAVRLA